MQNVFKLAFVVLSPLLAFVYWRNAMKELDHLNVEHDLSFAD